MMPVTVRDLRNRSAEVLGQVAQGESLVVTKKGEPVAVVSPLPRKRLSAEELIARRRNLPKVSYETMRSDLDEILDPGL
ncbi:type II toxin-antitoxin system prevent-host-death family antitoxin [Nesterenkonia sp. MY13]|uniref:Antitoxin n=1 Tax=Nesterenkonia sedimenti TaxID=1463632 RepID=A0A7X8THI4_9MICC|nr:type II toxin-antitoxin system prevent-host-death family antitoxin [Nesterenkonia sedimenti]NLS08838.1 type II toxin-antitoxin system prevent-host-death family antitoxin [Nesterenkonia sedimenti]